jgi:hypothetical protein
VKIAISFPLSKSQSRSVLTGLTNPVIVVLTIDDNTGTTAVTAQSL